MQVSGLNIHKIGLAGMVNHLARHDWRHGKIGGDVNDLVAQIARMGGAQFAVAFDVPFLQKYAKP